MDDGEGQPLGSRYRDQFTAFLGQNNGDIHALISHLGDLARQFKTAQQQPQR